MVSTDLIKMGTKISHALSKGLFLVHKFIFSYIHSYVVFLQADGIFFMLMKDVIKSFSNKPTFNNMFVSLEFTDFCIILSRTPRYVNS